MGLLDLLNLFAELFITGGNHRSNGYRYPTNAQIRKSLRRLEQKRDTNSQFIKDIENEAADGQRTHGW